MLRKKRGWGKGTSDVPSQMREEEEVGNLSPLWRVGVTLGLAIAVVLIGATVCFQTDGFAIPKANRFSYSYVPRGDEEEGGQVLHPLPEARRPQLEEEEEEKDEEGGNPNAAGDGANGFSRTTSLTSNDSKEKEPRRRRRSDISSETQGEHLSRSSDGEKEEEEGEEVDKAQQGIVAGNTAVHESSTIQPTGGVDVTWSHSSIEARLVPAATSGGEKDSYKDPGSCLRSSSSLVPADGNDDQKLSGQKPSGGDSAAAPGEGGYGRVGGSAFRPSSDSPERSKSEWEDGLERKTGVLVDTGTSNKQRQHIDGDGTRRPPLPEEISSKEESEDSNTSRVQRLLPSDANHLLVENTSDSLKSSDHAFGKSTLDADKVSGSALCDLTKGRWVRSPELSSYTESTCQYIPTKWRCRRESRDTNFSRWRWQPDKCNLEQFQADVFLELFRNKTIAYVGDSILRNSFISLLCLLNASSPVVPVNGTTFKTRFASFQAPRYGLTLHFATAHYLALELGSLQDFKAINRTRAGRYCVIVHLDRLHDRLKDAMSVSDALVIDSGQWYHATGKTKFYVRNSSLQDGLNDLTAFEEGMQTVVKYIKSRNFTGPIVFQSYSPSHFTGGDWNTGGQCQQTQPLPHDEVVDMERLSAPMRYLKVQQRVFSETGGLVQLLDITHLSMYRVDAHIVRSHRESLRDCLHWCVPGVPDTWNDMLFQILRNT